MVSYLITSVPLAGSRMRHWQARSGLELDFFNIEMILLAISSKLLVARARMVGPAPDRQQPRKPGCVEGDIELTISPRPGMRVLR